MGQVDGRGQTEDGNVVVVGDRVELVMDVDVGNGAHLTTLANDKQIVVSAGHAQENWVNQGVGGAVDHTVGGSGNVAVVQKDTLAVDLQRSVNGAVGGEFTDKGGTSSCDVRSELTAVLGEDGWKGERKK